MKSEYFQHLWDVILIESIKLPTTNKILPSHFSNSSQWHYCFTNTEGKRLRYGNVNIAEMNDVGKIYQVYSILVSTFKLHNYNNNEFTFKLDEKYEKVQIKITF